MEILLFIETVNYSKVRDLLLDDDVVARASVTFKDAKVFGGKEGYYCYDEATETLTRNGFKKLDEIDPNDEIATLNPENDRIEFFKPMAIHKFWHDGKMVHIKGKSYDLLVTPDHKIYCEFGFKSKPGSRKWQFIEAIRLCGRWKRKTKGGFRLKRTAKWKGEDANFFNLPEITTKWKQRGCWVEKLTEKKLNYAKSLRENGISYSKIAKILNVSYGRLWKLINIGKKGLTKIWNMKVIPTNLWLTFFGWFLGEGYSDPCPKNGNYKVVISQKKVYRSEIKANIENLGFNYYEPKDGFAILSKQLWSYLRQFGKSKDRYIPLWIKNLPPERLLILIEALTKAEGGYKSSQFCTSSKKLADDFQEILLKAGLTGTVYKHEKTGLYYVSINRKRKDVKINLQPKLVKYNGPVYDVTMPKNHIILTRRSGKIVWGSNCYISGLEEQCKKALELTKGLIKEVKDKEKEEVINKIKEEENKAMESFGGIFG